MWQFLPATETRVCVPYPFFLRNFSDQGRRWHCQSFATLYSSKKNRVHIGEIDPCEAKFMNIQYNFVEVLVEFSDLKFLYGFLTP